MPRHFPRDCAAGQRGAARGSLLMRWLLFLAVAGTAASVWLSLSSDREPPGESPVLLTSTRSAVEVPSRQFPSRSSPVNAAPADAPGSDLFAGTSVPAFTMEIGAAAMQSLRESPRQWTSATLRFGSDVFPDVAVHIKGSEGSLQPIDLRPSLTVSFNKFVPGRKFHGLKKIHFNNTAEDPTFMNEVITSELCRQAGLPAARSAHATLTLNGRDLGLYIVKEGLTKEFLAQHFHDPGGTLYDGGFQRDITEPWEQIGGDEPSDQADRLALLAAAREPDLARRWKRLEEVLDTDRFITLLAWTTITWNWDGYPMASNNYRVYHDPETDKLVFFPHGLDQMFWKAQGTIHPRPRGLVAAAMMQIPEVKRSYRDRLAALTAGIFDVERLSRRVDELTELITPYRPETPGEAARLKHLMALRARSIADQLQMEDPGSGNGRSGR